MATKFSLTGAMIPRSVGRVFDQRSERRIAPTVTSDWNPTACPFSSKPEPAAHEHQHLLSSRNFAFALLLPVSPQETRPVTAARDWRASAFSSLS